MHCRQCGELIDENAVICVKCGTEKGKGTEYCAHCGSKVEKHQMVCLNCGYAIPKEKSSFKEFVKSKKKAFIIAGIVALAIIAGLVAILIVTNTKKQLIFKSCTMIIVRSDGLRLPMTGVICTLIPIRTTWKVAGCIISKLSTRLKTSIKRWGCRLLLRKT